MSSIDFDILASRAVEPQFYRAPVPEKLPNGMVPMEFQFAGAEYVLNRNNALLGDEPGLTKTAQSIMVSNAIAAKHTLVVCPASLRLNWQREIWAWSTIPNVRTSVIMKGKHGVDITAHYVIISYDLLRNDALLAAIMDMKWDHLILDEAHLLKDPKGNKRTKAICAPDRLPSVVGRITMASGTILPNTPVECYNAVRLLNWEAIDKASLDDFKEAYYDIGQGWVNVYDPAEKKWKRKFSANVRNVPKNLDDLQHRLRKHVMVRRLKAQVLHELPAKRWHPFPIAMTSAIRDALKHPGWGEAGRLYEMDPDAFEHGVPIDGAISTARKLLGEAKAEACADYIEDLIDSGVDKLVVAAWHHTVLDYLRERLEHHGLTYMDGGTGMRKRQDAVDRFQNDDKVKIILGQNGPLGVGWTLVRAKDIVMCEWDWVPGMNDQLFDRIHRKGQRDAVMAHLPVVPGTMDEKMLGTAVGKAQIIYQALDA